MGTVPILKRKNGAGLHGRPPSSALWRRGIRLERKKDSTLLNTLKRPYAVKTVRIPLCGGSGSGVVPCVKTGELVTAGQKIADPVSFDGVPVHASVSGKVERIETVRMPDGSRCLALEIAGDGEPKPLPSFPENKKEAESFSRESLRAVFRGKGLLSLDEKMAPIHGQVHACVPAIVINCCEPEPYMTSGQVLLAAHAMEVLKGAELLRKAAGAEKVFFVFEAANRELFELIKSKIYLLKRSNMEARMVSSVYPFNSAALFLREFPAGSIAWNAATAFAVYEAVFCDKPFYERVVTVGGECIVEPRNLWLPVGFSFQDAVQTCKGFLRDPGKVLAGGPMTGTAQPDLQAPVTAGTEAILALPKEITKEACEKPCVRCNRCVDLCPVFISPAMITLASERGETGEAVAWGVRDCVECGVCGYVCPSERPMLDLIRLVK